MFLLTLTILIFKIVNSDAYGEQKVLKNLTFQIKELTNWRLTENNELAFKIRV